MSVWIKSFKFNRPNFRYFQIIRYLSSSEYSGIPKSIVFFGTDGFALVSLKLVLQNKTKGFIDKVHVVTSTKKPHVAVLKYCIESNIPYYGWPLQTPLHGFDLGIVVSFGHLIPESIIESFPLGILNVHGSLLPRWRGPAPVIHSVLNRDQKTGITIMKIFPNKFDVGSIVYQRCIEVERETKSKELALRMAVLGAECLEYCLHNLPTLLKESKGQPLTGITKAPKITKTDCEIIWEKMSPDLIHSMYLAFDDHQSLWSNWHGVKIKLGELCGSLNENGKFNIKSEACSSVYEHIKVLRSSQKRSRCDIEEEIAGCGGTHSVPGQLLYLRKEKTLRVRCLGGFVDFQNVSVKGKKTMTALEFYNGFISKVQYHKRYFY